MRRAKIVATLGPATSSYDQIEALVRAGMDVARLNMSHGEWDIHERSYANVRRAATLPSIYWCKIVAFKFPFTPAVFFWQWHTYICIFNV